MKTELTHRPLVAFLSMLLFWSGCGYAFAAGLPAQGGEHPEVVKVIPGRIKESQQTRVVSGGVQIPTESAGAVKDGHEGANVVARPVARRKLPLMRVSPTGRPTRLQAKPLQRGLTSPVKLERPPASGVAPARPVKPVGALSKVTLNFDNADIYQVIKTVSNILKLNYVIDPAVKGTVNIHTKGNISREDLFDIFKAVLKVNGAAITREGELYHVVPTQSVKTRLLIPEVGQVDFSDPVKDDVVLQVVRLKYISATEISNILKPFLSPGAEITPFEKNGIILFTDFATNIRKLTGIINLIDVNIFQEVRLNIYPIMEADVQEVAREMQKIFSAFEFSTKSGRGAAVNFIPIARINSLLVMSSVSEVFNEVEKWLEELDRNISQDEVRTFIYHVKNGIASELADILNSVFAQNKPRKTATPLSPAVVGQPQKGKTVDSGKKSLSLALGAQSAITGEVKVIPYTTTNTIIIKATPRDYPAVKRILSELDIIPRQVLIEILIAEVTMSDDMTLGIEYAFKGTDLGGGISKQIVGTSLSLSQAGTLATGGLTASIAKDNHIATINALASSNQINILASPHIIATDGKEASIDIGDEVPLIASKIFIDSREEITIERRDTGVILKVTPQINTTGLVTLSLSLELSDAASAVVAGESDIRIFQRNAKTTMVVQDNQTIVIGGLIDEKIEEEVTKVPFLGDIPLLGLLFRTKVNSVRKTELVLLITPHVISNLEQANSVTDEFIQRLEKIKDTLSQERVHGGGV